MKKFLKANPSYFKVGNSRIAEKCKIKESTVKAFKRTQVYKDMKRSYMNELAEKPTIKVAA